MIVLAAALVVGGCKGAVQDHIFDLCREAGVKVPDDGVTHADPCEMTQGQLRQWFVDNEKTANDDWIGLLRGTDSASQVRRLWDCRSPNSGHSMYDSGWLLDNQCIVPPDPSAGCPRGSSFVSYKPQLVYGKPVCGQNPPGQVLVHGFVSDCDYKDCPSF